jgi:hypothetical protein
MFANVLAHAFRGSEVIPLTTTDSNNLIAQYQNMVLLITLSSSDLQKLQVLHLCGFQLGNPLQDPALLALLNRWYQQGMETYLKAVVEAGNAEHLHEQAKLYLLRYGITTAIPEASGRSD